MTITNLKSILEKETSSLVSTTELFSDSIWVVRTSNNLTAEYVNDLSRRFNSYATFIRCKPREFMVKFQTNQK